MVGGNFHARYLLEFLAEWLEILIPHILTCCWPPSSERRPLIRSAVRGRLRDEIDSNPAIARAIIGRGFRQHSLDHTPELEKVLSLDTDGPPRTATGTEENNVENTKNISQQKRQADCAHTTPRTDNLFFCTHSLSLTAVCRRLSP